MHYVFGFIFISFVVIVIITTLALCKAAGKDNK